MILIALIGALPVVVLILVAGLEERSSRFREATRQNQRLADSTRWLERLVQHTRQSLQNLAERPELQAIDPATFTSASREHLQGLRLLDTFVFDRAGRSWLPAGLTSAV